MDLRTLLINQEYHTAIDHYGADAVQDEIDEMMHDSLASAALLAADCLGYKELATRAARIVSNSGCYSEEAKEVAEKYL